MTVTAGELLRETLRALRSRFGAVLMAVFVCTLPAVALRSLTPWLMREEFAAIRPDKVILNGLNLQKLVPMFETALSIAGVAVAILVFFVVLLALAQAVITPLVVGTTSGKVVSLREGFSTFASHAPTMIGIALAQTLLISLGTAACFVPGFFIAAGLLVAVPAAVTEELSIVEGVRRSWDMTKGFRTAILGAISAVLSLTYVTTTAVSLTATLMMNAPPSTASVVLAETVGSVLMVLLGAVYVTLGAAAYAVIRRARAESASQALI